MNKMKEQQYDFGMIGLGTMGRNFIYNLSDHGFSVAGFDKNKIQVESLIKESADRKIYAAQSLQDFMEALKTPRVIMVLVPAGPVVDSVINELKPFLSKDDLLMDCGNSHFTDSAKRTEQLAKENIHFMGVGVSGGESGARYGPSIMPGGAKEAYDRVADMLKAVSAKVKDEPCVSYMGPGGAGHYVKMVHNGIEYGFMQLIAEAYHFLKEALDMNNDELHQVFLQWNKGILQSYLIEITADIFAKSDDLTNKRLIDMILDSAEQKGTGQWTSQDALNLQTPIPSIDIAVTIRELSSLKEERMLLQQKIKGPSGELSVETLINKVELINHLEQALYFSMITTYAQGMLLLYHASKKYKFGLKLESIATIWRGGCIIRASLLEDIRGAFMQQPHLSNMLLYDPIAQKLMQSQNSIRKIIQKAVERGIPLPAMMVSLSYFDTYRRSWLPSNLLQAQRDYFGAHTYQRTDRTGIFHTHWDQKQK